MCSPSLSVLVSVMGARHSRTPAVLDPSGPVENEYNTENGGLVIVPDVLDPCAVLGISKSATERETKAAYKRWLPILDDRFV